MINEIMQVLDYQIADAPKNYGAFHIIMILLVILASALMCVHLKIASDKTFRKTLFIIWAVMVIGEIYHQLCFSFDSSPDGFEWSYPWYKFPFQFCSSPLYTLPFVIFLPDGRIRDGFVAFLASFSLFAGLAVTIYPNDVFCSTLGVNLQTMIHHGLQVVIGVFLAVRNREKLSVRFFLRGVPVFISILAIAFVMNEVGYHMLSASGATDTFNMFYISPYFDCTLPILCDLYPILPYPVFLMVYLFGFILVAALVYCIVWGAILLVQQKILKNEEKSTENCKQKLENII